MIKFKYIIGANIELDVVANILPAEPDVDYAGGVDIESVKLNGLYVETDEIYIRTNLTAPDYRLDSLDSLLELEALEVASKEKSNEITEP